MKKMSVGSQLKVFIIYKRRKMSIGLCTVPYFRYWDFTPYEIAFRIGIDAAL